jgi:hypothetical protein
MAVSQLVLKGVQENPHSEQKEDEAEEAFQGLCGCHLWVDITSEGQARGWA